MVTADADVTAPPASGDEAVDFDAAAAAFGCQDGDAKPFDLEFVTISRRDHIELKHQGRIYRTLHAKAVERLKRMQLRHDYELAKIGAEVAQLQADLELARAQNRDLRQRVFGATTEQSRSVNGLAVAALGEAKAAARPRGQQRGRRGHGRTRLPTLPSVGADVPGIPHCPQCGAAATPAWGSEEGQVLEIEVKAYRRVVRRQRYRPACRCGCLPGVVTAAAPGSLWPRNKLGVSIWVEVLLSKYLYGQPTSRLLQDWSERGLPIAQGTVTDGLHRLAPLLEPIMAACLAELRRASHWHADETRWEVFEEVPGKTGHRWYLWVFKSARVVCFVLDPSRSASVPTQALAGAQGGILSVDRYAAYRKFARLTHGMSLALCWAHQRRDFLRVANDHPSLWGWAMQWVQRVGELYELHGARRALIHDPASTAFTKAQATLLAHVVLLQRRCDTELAKSDPPMAAPARKVLRVLKSYWPGLLVFVDHPWLDLDNNAAERALRPAVVGRKNYYGSGSAWSGQLAAQALSVLGTMRMWGVNPRTWLQAYLQACAHARGKPPDDIDRFIPWHMNPAQLAAVRHPHVSRRAGQHPTPHDTS